MKHQWQPYASNDMATVMSDPQRKCTNCGAIQTHEPTGTWMRIGRRRWMPLTGKCSGVIADLRVAVAADKKRRATKARELRRRRTLPRKRPPC